MPVQPADVEAQRGAGRQILLIGSLRLSFGTAPFSEDRLPLAKFPNYLGKLAQRLDMLSRGI